MTKLTFWDTHNPYSPEQYTVCKGRYLKAVYILDDTWDGETVGEYDYGIFNCGYGDNTLNNGLANEEEGVTGKRPMGISWHDTPQHLGNPVRVNRAGGIEYEWRKPLRYPDKLQWVIHKGVNEEVWLYKPQLLQQDGCSSCYGRGVKAYDVTGWSFEQILDNCRKGGFDGQEIHQREMSEERTHPIGPRTGLGIDKEIMWSVEMDGRSIIPLIASRPKMTYAEIVNVIENEGGYVDDKGIIHKAR